MKVGPNVLNDSMINLKGKITISVFTCQCFYVQHRNQIGALKHALSARKPFIFVFFFFKFSFFGLFINPCFLNVRLATVPVLIIKFEYKVKCLKNNGIKSVPLNENSPCRAFLRRKQWIRVCHILLQHSVCIITTSFPSAPALYAHTNTTRHCTPPYRYYLFFYILFIIGPYGHNLLLSNIVMTVIIYAAAADPSIRMCVCMCAVSVIINVVAYYLFFFYIYLFFRKVLIIY